MRGLSLSERPLFYACDFRVVSSKGGEIRIRKSAKLNSAALGPGRGFGTGCCFRFSVSARIRVIAAL
jgi:hypothetical protein